MLCIYPASVFHGIACCDAPFIFLFSIQQLASQFTMSEVEWSHTSAFGNSIEHLRRFSFNHKCRKI